MKFISTKQIAIMIAEESNEVTSCNTNDIRQGNESKAPPQGIEIKKKIWRTYISKEYFPHFRSMEIILPPF